MYFLKKGRELSIYKIQLEGQPNKSFLFNLLKNFISCDFTASSF